MIMNEHLRPAGSKRTITYYLAKHVFCVRLILPESTSDSYDVVLALFICS